MDQSLTWIIGLSIVVSVIAIWRYRNGNESRKRFEQREELDLDTIYFWYFAHRGLPREQVIELWSEVAESLDLPAGKLRPSDRFEEDLSFPSGFGLEREIGGLMLGEMRRLERHGDANRGGIDDVQTLGDYIEYFCALELQVDQDSERGGQKSG